jgi:ankyrin repeat protein
MRKAIFCALLFAAAAAAAQTPEERLFEAIQESKPLVAEGLVADRAVNVAARNADGETALHRAVERGMRELAALLIKAGTSVAARSNSGETALHLAALQPDPWFVELLLAAKADPRARNDDGETPLHWAALSGNTATAERLIARGADPNIADIRGNLPLHGAADGGELETVKVLLRHTANRAARNREGRSAAEIARERGHGAIERLLMARATTPQPAPDDAPRPSQGVKTYDFDDPEHPRFRQPY